VLSTASRETTTGSHLPTECNSGSRSGKILDFMASISGCLVWTRGFPPLTYPLAQRSTPSSFNSASQQRRMAPLSGKLRASGTAELATFGLGCFWGVVRGPLGLSCKSVLYQTCVLTYSSLCRGKFRESIRINILLVSCS
jgi:hypothetical protein